MNTNRILPLLLSLFGCALLLMDCGGEQSAQSTAVPGVTDSTIVLGTWAPLTGPAAPWGATGRGAEAYFKMINDEGGIHGRTIRFILKDDQYQPVRTVGAVKEMVERDNVFAFVAGVGTAPGMAVKDYIIEHNVPWIGVLSGVHYWAFPPVDNIFGGLPLYFEEASVLVEYAVEELGKTKVAVFYQNDDYGKSGLVGAQMGLEKHGMEVVEALSAEVLDTDLSTQALRLRESGAEVVLLYVTPRHAANITGEAAKLGFQPQWMGSGTLADVGLMHALTDGLWEGTIFASPIIPDNSDHPMMQKFRAVREKYAPEERTRFLFYGGMAQANYVAEALRRAGPDLTRSTFIAAMATLDGYQSVGAPVSFADNPRHGFGAIYLARCLSATEVEQLSDWTRADLDIEAAIARLE